MLIKFVIVIVLLTAIGMIVGSTMALSSSLTYVVWPM
jgi:hypothetical protein